MNQQELEKHLFFQIAFIIFIFATMGFTIFWLLTEEVSAKQQTSTVTNSLYTDMGGDCTGGQSGYCILQTNGIAYRRQVNNTYNGVLNTISFDLHYVMNPSYQYTLNLYAMSSDFRNNNLSLYVCGYNSNNYSNCTTISASLRFVSKSQLQIIFPIQSYETYHVDIIGSPLTGVSTYGIKSAVLVYDDGSTDMSGVIDNQIQNTTDIINNNNSNTEQVVNTITDFFGNICSNFFEISNYSSNQFSSINITDSDVTVTTSQTWRILAYSFDVTSGKPYKFYYSSDSTGAIVYYSLNNSTWTQVQNKNYTSITPSSNKIYFRFQNASLGTGTYVFSNIMLYSGSDNKPYCIPNKPTSKLDEQSWYMEKIRDAQSETNDYLKDDSNPNINDSAISDTLESVSINDPLNYLLTLPLHTIQRINYNLGRDTCTPYNLGALLGTDLILPCVNVKEKLGTALFNTIDILIAIGIGSITLKKFYDSISNVLTLGKEKEVREKLELPTPMEFFAMIFGGGR